MKLILYILLLRFVILLLFPFRPKQTERKEQKKTKIHYHPAEYELRW